MIDPVDNLDRPAVPLGGLLDVESPAMSEVDAQSVALECFGLRATASTLGGERDRNFRLSCADGEFVLKVVHPAEDPGVSDFQSRALLHLAALDPGLATPRVIWPLRGTAPVASWSVEGAPLRRVRCLTFLVGRPLYMVASSRMQRASLGAFLARLNLALRDFRHPAEEQDLLWDIKSATRVRSLLAQLPDGDRRTLAEQALDSFATNVLPAIPFLRSQVIHNDFNPHNVICQTDSDQIAGAIDFGDMVRAPLVQDLATAAAYHFRAKGHPLAGPGDVITAFHAVLPLTPDEIEVLPEMIATRLAVTIVISSWRAVKHPHNAEYILRNHVVAMNGLRRLQEISRGDAIGWLRNRIER